MADAAKKCQAIKWRYRPYREMAKSAITKPMIRAEESTHSPNSIRAIRRSRDMSMAALGELIGTDASTVNKLEKGKMQLTERWIMQLVKALGVTADQLFAAHERENSQVTDVVVSNAKGDVIGAIEVKSHTKEVRQAPVEAPLLTEMQNNVPVMGTAAGSHLRGAFALDTSNVVDYVRRPPALLGASKAYALYIEGHSMEPKYFPGDLVFVHPDRPARMGDTVIIQVQISSDQPVEASIGTLRRRSEKFVTIGKLNPVADVDLKRETVVAIHKVLSMNDLFGV